MKVVLFCGGLGMRLRDYSDSIPKPMVPVGNRPIILHLMKIYAHYGHKEFILCLGHKGDCIKQFFLDYNECLTNDFVLKNGGANLELINRDIWDWNITFTDTGLRSNIGGRLKAVQRFVENEDVFLANYTDNLSDVDLDAMISAFLKSNAVAGFACVRPNFTFHIVQSHTAGQVKSIVDARRAGLWSNGGFFVFRPEIFDYLHEGEELVEQPFQRLIDEGRLFAYRHEGFWACMDTFKEKQQLDDLYQAGSPPWEVWDSQSAAAPVSFNGRRLTAGNGVTHA
jgi:glucose-1-phosphate cytidylyltransferase